MWQNVMLSLSNLSAIYPLMTLFNQDDKIGFCIILASLLSSMAFHLIEHQTHGMPGIGYFSSQQAHQTFIWIDRIFACLSIIYFLPDLYNNMIYTINVKVFYALGALILSDIIHTTPETQLEYIIYHMIWHDLAYCTLDMILLLRVI